MQQGFELWRAAALKNLRPGQKPLLPQPGFQYKFLSSPADIVIGGGSAGGGKTYALLIEAARHRWHPDFAAMVFRRQFTEIKNPGGLWDEAKKLYGATVGGRPVGNPLTWHFPSPLPRSVQGARVVFSHLQHEKDVTAHHGGQYASILFDELYTFLESQFWYLLSRNRTDTGIKPTVRCTTNPETSGFVKDLVQWYLYPDDHPDPTKAGYPIPERDGVIRYLARDAGLTFWGNTPAEVIRQVPHLFIRDDGIAVQHKIKSFTFIQGGVYGNKELLKKNPGYVANLMAQSPEDRDRLLHGCWKYRPGGHELFDYDALLDVRTNNFVKPGRGSAQKFITADIALEGSDLFVVMVWDGFRLVKCYAYEKSPGPAIVKTLREIAQAHGVPQSNICYDRDGVGGFLAGYLPGAYGFRGNASPLPEVFKRKGAEVPNYENLKAQVAYLAADMVLNAGLYIEPDALEDWMWQRLIEECRAHLKRDHEKAAKLKISLKAEVRAKIKRSHDFFDCFTMRQVFRMRKRGSSATY